MTINNGAATPPDTELDFNDWSRGVRSSTDFSAFVLALVAHFRQNPDSWENKDLASFLEALGAWAEDMDGYFKSRGESVPEAPTWAAFAQMLLAAKVYE